MCCTDAVLAGDANLSRYVRNDPATATDPSGLADQLLVGADAGHPEDPTGVYYQLDRGWYNPRGWAFGDPPPIRLGDLRVRDGEEYVVRVAADGTEQWVRRELVQQNKDSTWGNTRGGTWESWLRAHAADFSSAERTRWKDATPDRLKAVYLRDGWQASRCLVSPPGACRVASIMDGPVDMNDRTGSLPECSPTNGRCGHASHIVRYRHCCSVSRRVTITPPAGG